MESDGLSSMLGWVSIACWIVVYSPQIIENYRRKSGEGLSVSFVLIWLAGDLFNLTGAIWAGLIPTVIILALYYSFCDLILLCQIYYYRWLAQGKPEVASDFLPDRPREESPLLCDDIQKSNTSQKTTTARKHVASYISALLFVFVAGITAWWISSSSHVKGKQISKPLEWKIQFLGWISAILYLGARIPQIFKNLKTRCEGLSPALFLFAILGNTTYALSICAESVERDYLIMNASWLAGSALTIVLDVAVLCQFCYYRSYDHAVAA